MWDDKLINVLVGIQTRQETGSIAFEEAQRLTHLLSINGSIVSVTSKERIMNQTTQIDLVGFEAGESTVWSMVLLLRTNCPSSRA